MRTVTQDGTIDLTVVFRMSNGQLVDPDNPHAEIVSTNGSVFLVVDSADVERLDIGTYKYTFVTPPLADLGEWTVRWYGTFSGMTATISEVFEVVAASTKPTTAAVVARLRRLIGERIPIGKTEVDTRFTDQEIIDVYHFNNEDWNKALAELWFSKAAYLGDLVDINESGTMRSLSQMGKAAMVQASKYEARAMAEDTSWAATYRTVGRAFNPYCARSGTRLVGAVVVFSREPSRMF